MFPREEGNRKNQDRDHGRQSHAEEGRPRPRWRTVLYRASVAALTAATAADVGSSMGGREMTPFLRSGDGRLFGLDAATGVRKWVYARTLPALTVRSTGRPFCAGSFTPVCRPE